MTFDKTSYFRLLQREYGHLVVLYWLNWLIILLCVLLATIQRAELIYIPPSIRPTSVSWLRYSASNTFCLRANATIPYMLSA